MDNLPSRLCVSINLSLGDRQLSSQFQEIPLDLHMVETERIDFDILKKQSVDKLPDVYKFVDNVVADNIIRRFIADAVASIPKMAPLAFDSLVNEIYTGPVAVAFIFRVFTRTQLSLTEKLNTAAQIL